MKDLYRYRKFFAFALGFFFSITLLKHLNSLTFLASLEPQYLDLLDSSLKLNLSISAALLLVRAAVVILLFKRKRLAFGMSIGLDVATIAQYAAFGNFMPADWIGYIFSNALIWLVICANESHWVAIEEKFGHYWKELSRMDEPERTSEESKVELPTN
jgi:hypothetical protein